MKVCINCGCNLPDDHEGNICECCLDDRGDTIPDGLRRGWDPVRAITTPSDPKYRKRVIV